MATIPRTGAPGRLGAWAPHSAAGGCGGLEVLECQIAHGRASGEAWRGIGRVGRRGGPVAGRIRLPFGAGRRGARGEKPLERA